VRLVISWAQREQPHRCAPGSLRLAARGWPAVVGDIN